MAEKTVLSYGPDLRKKSTRFWILLALSGVIATAGVAADSPATVIGAMIVAPLMTPILGTAFALVIADRHHLLHSMLTVLGGALLVIAIAFLFSMVEPLGLFTEGNSQVTARVHPRLIDLIAALATGMVGAFVMVRSDISDTLPGVAIAISLVPPLAVVGLTLQDGKIQDALGALLKRPARCCNITSHASPGEEPMDGMQSTRLLLVLAAVSIVLLPSAPADAEPWEAPPTLRTDQVIANDLLRGEHYQLGDTARVESYYYIFELNSHYGNLVPVGTDQLYKRIDELQAIESLEEISKSDVFLDSAGQSLKSMGDSLSHIAEDPEGTAKGLGRGFKRFSINLGRKTKRAMDDASEEAAEVEQSGGVSAEQVEDAANSALGVNESARVWAQKLHVDPYSRNPHLQEALLEVARVDAAGHAASKVVVPMPTLVGTTTKVSDLVWAEDPEALLKTNEASLRAVGVADAIAQAFFANESFTLTDQTRFANALAAVKARGLDDYVDAARLAESPREAVFYVESAEMLQRHHGQFPVSAVLTDSRAIVALSGAGGFMLLPLDYLPWTEHVDEVMTELTSRSREELGARAVEVRISGRASDRSKRELERLNWSLKEGVPLR